MSKVFFDPAEYDKDVGMRFDSREEHDAFCEYLDIIGKRWGSGDRYTERNYFDHYLPGEVVYYFNRGLCSDMPWAEENMRTVLTYSDFYYYPEDAPEPNIGLTFSQLFGDEQTTI